MSELFITKVIPPENREALKINSPEQCPYRFTENIKGNAMQLCKFESAEGFLRICSEFNTYKNVVFSFPKWCPLEDLGDYKKRVHEETMQEAKK